MLLHRHESFKPVRHRSCNNNVKRFDQFVGRRQCRSRLSQKHRPVDFEVIIVAAIQRVEIIGPCPLQEFAVRFDTPRIAATTFSYSPHRTSMWIAMWSKCPARGCSADRHGEVRAPDAETFPSDESTCAAGPDGSTHRRGCRTHLPGLIWLPACRPRRRLPSLQIPQGPRRTVHDRFCEQCRDIQIAGICLMHAAHRIYVGVVP